MARYLNKILCVVMLVITGIAVAEEKPLPDSVITVDGQAPSKSAQNVPARRATTGFGSLDDHLVAIVAAEPAEHYNTLREALQSIPQETNLVITTAIEAGYKFANVIDQCEEPLQGFQIAGVIEMSLDAGADIEEVFPVCLPVIPQEELVSVVAKVLQGLDPLKVESTIQMALSVFTEEGMNSSTILVESLLAGGLIESDDTSCVGDCLRPLAEDLIENLTAGFESDTGFDVVDEPALSDS